MRFSIYIALFLFIVPFCLAGKWSFETNRVITQGLVDHINSLETTWKARLDQGFVSGLTFKEAKKLCGVLPGGSYLPSKMVEEVQDIPDNFDSRTNWPTCVTMKQIRDQSACGSCWAFGAAEAISDRTCVFNVDNNFVASTDDLLACCHSCGFGCGGGYPSQAWEYWVSQGLVDEGCLPYPFPSCDHHIDNSTNPCPSVDYPTPPCKKQCQNSETYSTAKRFGQTAFSVHGESQIKNEIFKNGPLETSFSVYEDFLTYSSGVYQHKSGKYLGGHAVKFLGWGVENGTPYWLVANSWNSNWGDEGYFKILRGTNECGIEATANGGEPKK